MVNSPILGRYSKKESTMNMYDKRGRRYITLIGAAFVAASFLAIAGPVSAAPAERFHGTFNETAVGQGLGYDIHGSAKMTVGSNYTAVKVNIAGLDAGTEYTSHLHNKACTEGDPLGGGHYRDNPQGGDTPPNELWLTNHGEKLVANNGGVAHGSGSEGWAARTSSPSLSTNARSVIVHAPGGARIACADLQ